MKEIKFTGKFSDVGGLTELPTDKITRIEVIDEIGRALVRRDVKVEISIQDDGRTMKVFVRPVGETELHGRN